MVGNENKVNNYYNVSNGKIVRSFGKTKPEGIKTHERVNKNGETVYEQLFDFIQADIVDASLQSHEQYGDSIKLRMEGDGLTAELSILFDSSYGRSFLFKIPNVDIKKEFKISPYAFLNKEGKNIVGLNIHQSGEKIINAYSRENPNGLPQLKKVKFNGKEQWDKTEQLAFLRERFDEFLAQFKEVVVQEEVSNLNDLDF